MTPLQPWPRRRFIATALGAGGALAALPALAQFRIEIAGVGATQIPLAMSPFRDEAGAGVAVSQVIGADLERSGVIRMIPADVADERATVDAAAWRGRGADALVAGSVARLADGRFDVRYRLWDTVKDQQLLGRSQLVLGPDLRLAAHRIADEIHEKLTGERGVNATRIAYVSKRGPRRFSLHITDADGEGGQVALASPEPIISPAWSPDGKRIAYVSFEDQKAVVWMQNLLTGERSRVANFRGSNSAPAFSPDGQRLAVTLSQDGPSQIYTLPLMGGAPQRVTVSQAIDTEPVFAPDGRTLYFVSDRGGGPQIYRVALGGGSVERVTFQGSYNISPALSPDGRQLAYITRQGNAFRLMLQELETGTVLPLSETNDDESPSFAPNGRLIVYATRQQGSDVLMTTTLDGKIKTRLLSSGADMREPAWGPFGR
jgi:TolB protein